MSKWNTLPLNGFGFGEGFLPRARCHESGFPPGTWEKHSPQIRGRVEFCPTRRPVGLETKEREVTFGPTETKPGANHYLGELFLTSDQMRILMTKEVN